MKQALKLLLLISVTVLVTACKLDVIVVKGGEVQSLGSGTCMAGSICIVEVTDPNFSETFTAVPDTGWYFQKWNSGEGFFCGGSNEPTCTLSFKGFEDSKAVEDMVASSEVFYLMPVFRQFKDIITVDGKQWYQPNLFAGLSWKGINAVCPAGECTGLLNGYDVTGWTWASVNAFNALVNYYIGSNELGPGLDSYQAAVSVGAAFFSDGWQPSRTWLYPSTQVVNGLVRPDKYDFDTRDYNYSSPWNCGYLSYVPETVLGYVDSGTYVEMRSTHCAPSQTSSPVGAWFYRSD